MSRISQGAVVEGRKITSLQSGESEGFDETGEALVLHTEDDRSHCMREAETGKEGTLKTKQSLLKRNRQLRMTR